MDTTEFWVGLASLAPGIVVLMLIARDQQGLIRFLIERKGCECDDDKDGSP